MSVPISSHEKKRATSLNHWKEGKSFLGGLDLQLALYEKLVPLGFVKAWAMGVEEGNFVGPVEYVEIVLRGNFFEA